MVLSVVFVFNIISTFPSLLEAILLSFLLPILTMLGILYTWTRLIMQFRWPRREGLSDRVVEGTVKFGGGNLMMWGCMG